MNSHCEDDLLQIKNSSKISLTQTNQEKNNMELPYDLPEGRMASPKNMNIWENFQTAFDPPSFSGIHVAISFLQFHAQKSHFLSI